MSVRDVMYAGYFCGLLATTNTLNIDVPTQNNKHSTQIPRPVGLTTLMSDTNLNVRAQSHLPKSTHRHRNQRRSYSARKKNLKLCAMSGPQLSTTRSQGKNTKCRRPRLQQSKVSTCPKDFSRKRAVNKHMMNFHRLRGKQGEARNHKQQEQAGSIKASLSASKRSCAGTKR